MPTKKLNHVLDQWTLIWHIAKVETPPIYDLGALLMHNVLDELA